MTKMEKLRKYLGYMSSVGRSMDPPYDMILINLTSRCNMRCVYCELHELDPQRDMDSDRIMRLMAEAHGMGIRRVCLSGGEPFVHPRIWDFIGHGLSLGMELSFYSNGLFAAHCNDEHIRLLQETAGLTISLDTFRKDTFNALRGGDFFDRVIAAIDRLRDAGIGVYVNAVITSDNMPDMPELVRFLHRLGVSGVFFQPIHIWSNFNETGPTAAKRSLVPDPEKMEPIVRECLRLCRSLRLKTSLPLIAPWLKPYFQNQLLADNGLDRRWYTRCVSHFRCKEIFTRIFVQADGGLLPCAMLGPVANVKDRSLADAVTAMDALKRDFRNGRFHPDCYKCSCQMPANYSYSLVCAPYANFARICAYLYDSGRLTEPFRAIFHRKSYRKAIQGSVV